MERIDYYCFVSPLTNSLKAGNLLWLKIFLWNNKLCFWICLLFFIVRNIYGGFEASWDPNWPGSETVVKYAKHFILWEFLCCNDILTRQQYKSPRCGPGETRGRVQWSRLQGGGNIGIENPMPCLHVVRLYSHFRNYAPPPVVRGGAYLR